MFTTFLQVFPLFPCVEKKKNNMQVSKFRFCYLKWKIVIVQALFLFLKYISHVGSSGWVQMEHLVEATLL